MFYEHQQSGFIKLLSVGLLIIVASYSVADEPYPSTLDDYVTLYQIKSYELFRHDSAEYDRRIERGKKALLRMKKHGGRSGKAATRLWFETAVYSKDTADELPGLPALAYLKDVDPSAVAKVDTPQEPAIQAAAEEATSQLADATDQVEETQGFAFADTVASLSKAVSSSADAGAIADDVESVDVDNAKSAVTATTNVLGGLASSVFRSLRDATSKDDSTPQDDTSDFVDVGPFPEVQPTSESAFDTFAPTDAAESSLADEVPATVDVNGQIAEFNEAVDALQPDVLVALGGDGTGLGAVVERIEHLVDTQSGIQVQQELNSHSMQSTQAMTDLAPVVEELHKGIFKFPKSQDGLPFKRAVRMLKRLESVQQQLDELSSKA